MKKTKWGYNTYIHGNITRKLPASLYLKLKCHVFVLSFLFFLLQNRRIGGWNDSCPEVRAGTSGKEKVLGKGLGK
jgi:hypothetical protein